MQEASSRLRVTHVLCEVTPGFQCAVGRIDGTIIKNTIRDFSERMFYLCGPPAMVEAMKVILSGELKLAAEQIITENFTGY